MNSVKKQLHENYMR